jgi:hypothetical protein
MAKSPRVATTITVFAAILWLAGAGSARAIDIEQARWGFDGKATSECFNVLSVLISNHSSQPYDGAVELHKSMERGNAVDAPLREEVYLSPFASRWVQFYPYVKADYEEWSLHWGPRMLDSVAGSRRGERRSATGWPAAAACISSRGPKGPILVFRPS